MSLFRRALIAILGAICLILATAAFGPLSGAAADPPPQAQNDGNGNSDSPGPGNGNGEGQDNAGSSNASDNAGGQGNGNSRSNTGGSNAGDNGGGQSNGGASAGGSSGSNPDGGGLDKPDCEATAEGCQGPAPRDGNNGCGNEAEPKSVRDDDNNGNCGGGQDKDEPDGTVAAAGARAAWTGADTVEVIAAAAVAAQEAARAAGEPAVTSHVDAEVEAEVMGVTVERAAATADEVDLDDLELARDRASRSGGRSLLALTGMALLTLLAAGLFVLGLGRLFRGAEGDLS